MGWISATRVTTREEVVGMPIPIPPELTPHTLQPSPNPAPRAEEGKPWL